jgi:hypothetical protein
MASYLRSGLKLIRKIRSRRASWGEKAQLGSGRRRGPLDNEVGAGRRRARLDQYYYADSNDEDDFGFGSLHLRDLVCVELMQMFQKEYW